MSNLNIDSWRTGIIPCSRRLHTNYACGTPRKRRHSSSDLEKGQIPSCACAIQTYISLCRQSILLSPSTLSSINETLTSSQASNRSPLPLYHTHPTRNPILAPTNPQRASLPKTSTPSPASSGRTSSTSLFHPLVPFLASTPRHLSSSFSCSASVFGFSMNIGTTVSSPSSCSSCSSVPSFGRYA